MTKVKNNTGGSRAILVLGGEALFADGEEKEVNFAPGGITAARMIGLTVDGEEEDAGSAGAKIASADEVDAARREVADAAQADLSAAQAEIEQLKAALAKSVKPVPLSGKSKADLLDIAKAEGVSEVSDTMTVADITSAIELHREAQAKA